MPGFLFGLEWGQYRDGAMSDDLYDRISEQPLENFRPQVENANLHTPRGTGMLEKSIGKVGWFGAVTVAADGEAFDGSLRLETIATTLPDATPIVVDIDGHRPVILRRTDIPTANDPIAREASVLANRVAEVSLNWDIEVLESWQSDGAIELGDWFTDTEMAEWDVDADTSTSRFTPDDEDVFAISEGGTPLAIVLSSSEIKEWNIIKESIGASSDKAAFLKLMRGEV